MVELFKQNLGFEKIYIFKHIIKGYWYTNSYHDLVSSFPSCGVAVEEKKIITGVIMKTDGAERQDF